MLGYPPRSRGGVPPQGGWFPRSTVVTHPSPSAEAKKGGKPTSWLKTLLVGYLVCNGGVDLSTWVSFPPRPRVTAPPW